MFKSEWIMEFIYFAFAIKTRHKSVSRGNGKITRKEMSKLFLCGYLTTHYSMVKCLQNDNFEEIDTETSTGENDRVWLLWGIFKEYIRQNIYYDGSIKKSKFQIMNNYI